jgi:PAS domain-containing protein
MIRHVLDRLSLRSKFIVAFLIVVGGAFGSVYLLMERIDLILLGSYQIEVDLFRLYIKVISRYVFIGIGISCVGLLFLFVDLHHYLTILNSRLSFAIAKKRIKTSFPVFSTGDILEGISLNANALMNMFKTFDNMKSSRLSLEVTSIKLVMNSVLEAILLVNIDGVVTHVNHHAEDLLRLIPGEIIGESISRHISNVDLLTALDKSVHHDQRTIDQVIAVKENVDALLTVLPVKNKFGELSRSIILLKRIPS